MTSIADLLKSRDALGLAEMVRRREVGAEELLEAAITQVEKLNPRYNFMAQRHYDFGRSAIAAGLPDGPFTGVPWLLKDLNTYIAGEVTGQGSRYFKGVCAAVTSELVVRYQRAGLVIFGKTTTPEFGLTPTTESKATGVTPNPWNMKRSAGGSSGGAAVAVATGILPAAHATDGGGSIRIPAACCGLFGLKPSRGRVPMGPLRTEGWGGMSTHHAISRSVRDSAALLDATHGLEAGSRYAAPMPERSYLEEVSRAPGKLRIAMNVSSPSGGAVDAEIVAAVRRAAILCESLGHDVVEAAPMVDFDATSRAAGAIISPSLAADLQARAAITGEQPNLDVVEAITLALYHHGATLLSADFVRANHAIQTAAVTIARFMEDFDILLTPTLTSLPPELGVLSLSADPRTQGAAVRDYVAFTALQDQTGQPSMSVPLGQSQDGLPIGIMFSARYGDEASLFRLAGQLERAAPWADRRPAV